MVGGADGTSRNKTELEWVGRRREQREIRGTRHSFRQVTGRARILAPGGQTSNAVLPMPSHEYLAHHTVELFLETEGSAEHLAADRALG